MTLALSSEAAPGASLGELANACARRGVSALHLVAGHAHGITLDMSAAATAAARARLVEHDVRVSTLEITDIDGVAPEDAASTCAQLDAALIATSAIPVAWRSAFERGGGKLVQQAELNPIAGNVASAWCELADARIMHILLRGAGPEAARYEGRGIGTLMAPLSLSAWSGVLTIAPTSAAVLPVWNVWLWRGKSWGCGSKTADSTLLQLRQP